MTPNHPAPVLHVDDARSWRGGQQQVLYLHRGLLRRGVPSLVVCQRGGSFHDRLEAEGLPFHALRMRGGHDLRAARRLAGLAAGGILHAHTSHAHDLALWASRWGHAGPIVVSRRVDFPIRGPLALAKYRNRRITRYLSISSGVETMLLAGGVAAARIRRVPSGVDFRRFDGVDPDREWAASFGADPREPLFGNVAALAPHKDQATLLRAFGRHLDAGGRGHLVILGEGGLRPQLEALRSALGLDQRVHLPGFVDHILARMAALDVMVMSSKTEGLGTAILDAMALGVPVVATRTGGIPDAVIDGETGLLVSPSDPAALANALRRIHEDPGLRDRLRTGAARHVRSFDVERTLDLTLAAYGELA